MWQKIGIVIVLAKEVKVMLFDELIFGLDFKASNEFVWLLMQFSEQGMVVLMVIYDLFWVKEIVIWIGIMWLGQLLQELQFFEIGYIDLEFFYF